METETVKKIIEAAVLAAEGPLDLDAMQLLFDEHDRPEKSNLKEALAALAEDYSDRGIELREVASGYRFQVRRELGPWVSRLWQEKPPRYSRAILETLALIAYRQPITRGEIEEIRGVAVSTQIMRTLLERGWVRIVGHRDVVGRPAMYATTRQFLDYFDMKSLDELPTLAEIRDLDKINEELALDDAEFAGEQTATEQPDESTVADAQDEAAEGQSTEGQSAPDSPAITASVNDEPEIDESTLMDMEKVDSVLAQFEAQFRQPKQNDAEAEPEPESQAEPQPVQQEARQTSATENADNDESPEQARDDLNREESPQDDRGAPGRNE